MRVLAASSVLFLCVAACGGGSDVELFVDLRTDLVPGEEWSGVAVRLSPPAGSPTVRERIVHEDEPVLEGMRVAEFRGLSKGRHEILLSLLDARGDVVLARPLLVSLEGSRTVTVLATRDCRNVRCDGGGAAVQACLGGRCVEATCAPESREGCGEPACREDADCEATAACALARCISGECFAEPREDACEAEQWCDAETGCRDRAVRDAGVADGGATDAGAEPTDAGAEPTDAGEEPMDGGSNDAGGGDAGCSDETCNALDDDCDGAIDEGIGTCEPCDVEVFDGSTYLFCETLVDFDGARTACEMSGYVLATIETEAENTALTGIAGMRAHPDWWFGLHDQDGDDTYTYVSGSDASYRNWRGGDREAGRCAFIDEADDGWGRWHDADCSRTEAYICETP